jgi:hypothetical protein
MLTHLGAGLSLSGMWLLLRGGATRRTGCEPSWPSGLVLASTWLVVRVLAAVHLARAIDVPSSARLTALISAIAGGVIVVVIFRSSTQVVLQALQPDRAALRAATSVATSVAQRWKDASPEQFTS